MKTMKIGLILFLLVNIGHSQSVKLPLQVFDRGGGKLSGGSLTLSASIGQTAVQAMSGTGFSLESGYIPGLRSLSASALLMVPVEANWNMVSVPLVVPDYHKSVLFPGASSSAFGYSNGYRIVDSLANGAGYWLKFPVGASLQMSGTSLQSDTISVRARWNMIGAFSYPLLTSEVVPDSPVTITSYFFGFSNVSGYFRADTLEPGHAYWVKVSGDGQLATKPGSVVQPTMSSIASSKSNNAGPSHQGVVGSSENEQFSSLTITDAQGRERAIYFSSKVDSGSAKFELPPPPPTGIFDVRFESQRLMEAADETSRREISVLLSSAKYPITVRWNNKEHVAASLVVNDKEVAMNADGVLQVSNPSQIHLKMEPVAHVALPQGYALSQNYPNPFNPTTTIRYGLPLSGRVTLKVYNVLGQVVQTLVDGIQDAGYRSIQWNASGVASGIYFYRLYAVSTTDPTKSFTQVKKMLMIK